MTQEVKLSQYSAILLENARRSGISDEEILEAVRTENTELLKAAERPHYTYESFFTYAKEHGELLNEAITEGYRITFNTNNGLKNWIATTFQLDPNEDFTSGEGRVEGLILSQDQVEKLEQALAFNWHIKAVEDTADGRKQLTLTLRGQ
ncbi:hypothetical protein [Paenibacillus sp. Marseille-Q4541]|uniref:hypothetical protein n=1 Tax=Paenibacillus sp. Marseille-Q4541 TaxID=2831522 RepID=UPI001BAB0957|nr:hypothetical protein [Paenibacillus sp. Marseille-Q4541]